MLQRIGGNVGSSSLSALRAFTVAKHLSHLLLSLKVIKLTLYPTHRQDLLNNLWGKIVKVDRRTARLLSRLGLWRPHLGLWRPHLGLWWSVLHHSLP
jgi:hypothetical protein